ncbi:hypothetical protein J5N97_023070 [Dioscorea zingiberensis]|uniref:Glycosyltransferase N-terminal domain-containing protein n=1 Tax=Dioscorea zingiberensis TaxID=325984 RepID=A0A9D5CCA9_9LILI|nr:hypothetical protein J5N97_023070 [Dioscorea zingiberensis]
MATTSSRPLRTSLIVVESERVCVLAGSAFYHLSFHQNHHRLLDPIPDCFTDEFLNFRNSRHYDQDAVEDGFIINSCLPIEAEFIELLSRQPRYQGKRVFAVGPINPVVVAREEDGGGGGRRHECLRWMDQQPENSVLYVAFGTTSMITDHQIEELAMGLEKSRQRFIWVLRDADGGDVFADEKKAEKRSLPEGYEERIEGMGMVVRGWAPQLEILGHRAIGAFMSHCGWNSCMESLSFGVPLLAWPMHSDQPRNAMAVTEYLKVGVMVRDWEHRKEVVTSMEIVEVVKRLMVSDEGIEMRKRVVALGEQIRAGVSEGGSSWKDLNSFISHITAGL